MFDQHRVADELDAAPGALPYRPDIGGEVLHWARGATPVRAGLPRGHQRGFTTVFTALGLVAGAFGSVLTRRLPVINLVRGAVVIGMGLVLTGLVRDPVLHRQLRPDPFLLLAAGLARGRARLGWLRRHSRPLEIGGGVPLVLMGVAMRLDRPHEPHTRPHRLASAARRALTRCRFATQSPGEGGAQGAEVGDGGIDLGDAGIDELADCGAGCHTAAVDGPRCRPDAVPGHGPDE